MPHCRISKNPSQPFFWEPWRTKRGLTTTARGFDVHTATHNIPLSKGEVNVSATQHLLFTPCSGFTIATSICRLSPREREDRSWNVGACNMSSHVCTLPTSDFVAAGFVEDAIYA